MNDSQRQRAVLLATSLSYVIVTLDVSIVNVALEEIAHSLASGIGGLQWVVTAYTLAFASLLLSGGTLADRFGARNVYVGGLALFIGASALCGVAHSLVLLVAGRMLQGVGAALLVPASMKLINDTWPNPRERAAVFGVWAGLGGMAMASGPLAGGILIGLFGWRSIFLVNVPVCLAGVILALRVPATKREPLPGGGARGFDFAGQIAAIAALASLNISVIALPRYGWHSIAVVASLSVALAAALAFVAIEARGTQPMLPLDLFRHPVFSGAVWVSMVSAFTFYGLMFDLSLLFQRALGYTPLHAGLAFLPLTIVVPIGSLMSKRAAAWLGEKWSVVGAFLLAAAGYVALAAIGPSAPYALLALPLPAIGLAASLVTPLTAAAMMASVERHRAGVAAGALNAARQTGALLGVALSGAGIAGISQQARIGDGMPASFLIAGMLSACAGAIWWRALTRSESRDRLVNRAVNGAPSRIRAD